MQPKIFMVEAIRKVNVKETYFVISEKEDKASLATAIQTDKLTPVDTSQEVLGYEDEIKVDTIELVNSKFMRLMRHAASTTASMRSISAAWASMASAASRLIASAGISVR